jgi:BlaI family penicillinase repressor
MAEVSISDAEWQVMNVIWNGQPLTSQDVIAALAHESDWAAATVKTMLHRLVKKGVLAFEEQGNRYVYRARIKRSACVKDASRSFLDRVFGGAAAPLLAHFMRNAKLTPTEIAELRRMLDEQKGR